MTHSRGAQHFEVCSGGWRHPGPSNPLTLRLTCARPGLQALLTVRALDRWPSSSFTSCLLCCVYVHQHGRRCAPTVAYCMHYCCRFMACEE